MSEEARLPPGAARKIPLALGLLSCGLIAYELALMQLLSLIQWYHFAYLVISVALLGFGASGSLLALWRQSLLPRMETILPLAMAGCAVLMVSSLLATQTLARDFDLYQLFVDPAQFGLLLFFQLLFFLPFLLGALPIGLAFVQATERVGSLYCANLLGSGLGGLVALGLMFYVAPGRLAAVCALFPLAASLLLFPGKRGPARALVLSALAAGLLILAVLLKPVPVVLSQYKDLSHALYPAGARLVGRQPSPRGLVQAVASPVLRYAPGLSLTYRGEIPPAEALFSNGDFFGAVRTRDREAVTALFDHSLLALPYAVADRKRVLVLHAATGDEVLHALARGAAEVTAVEPHRQAVGLFQGLYGSYYEELNAGGRVGWVFLEPRAMLAAASRYDLITLPLIGSFGGSAGIAALQEQYLLTVEAFSQLWHHLEPDGVLRVSVWLDQPVRNPLKTAATIAEMLENAGISEPFRHVAAIRDWSIITFLVKRTPFSGEEAGRIRDFCAEMEFDLTLGPGRRPQTGSGYHRRPDESFFSDLDLAFSARRGLLYERYDFDVRPAADDRPFFSQFLRWQSLPELGRIFGEKTLPFLELGYVVVGVTVSQMAGAALVLILLPLSRLGWRGPFRLQTVTYFAGLGLGYMFVEIVLIHQFILYLGDPLQATATVLGALLFFSGCGSLFSARIREGGRLAAAAPGMVVLTTIAIGLALPFLLRQTIASPFGLRVLLAVLLIAPPGFAMGFPFPLGLRRLAGLSPDQVPWAWGINGCVSVLAGGLATLAAVAWGFQTVMLIAAAAYGVAALTRWE
ncbi:MAG: spermidine synthase-like protein [Thermodesulfobacteriota bacterium]